MDGFARLERQLVASLETHVATGRPPDVPEAGALLWRRHFAELCGTRSYGPNGPNPIAFAEIEAWARLMRWPLQPHHVAAIRALDDAWLEHAYARRSAGDRKTLPASSGQALTPALFDLIAN